jgi:O-antigen ligase
MRQTLELFRLRSPGLKGLGLTGLVIVAAAVLGMAAPTWGTLILGALLAPASALFAFAQPLLGIYTVTVTLPVEDLIPGIGGATGAKVLGILVFASWLSRKVIIRDSWRAILSTDFFFVSLVALFWVFASALWAKYRGTTFQGVFTQIQLFALSLLVIDLITSWNRFIWLGKFLVVGGLIAAVAAMDQYFLDGVKRAGDGITGGINHTASTLVTIIPFAFYTIRAAERRFWRFLGFLYIVCGTIAVAVTFSRTSYILISLTLIVHFIVLATGRRGRGSVLLLGGAVVIAALFLPWELIQLRAETIAPSLQQIAETANAQQEEAADVRAYHWRIGWTMFKDYPFTGVGFNNYNQRFLEYQFRVPGSNRVYGSERSPHSSYVGLLANVGLIGLALWLVVFAVAIRSTVIAWSLVREQRTSNKYFFVQAVTFSLFLQLFYGWSLNVHENKIFWLILGSTVAMRRLADGTVETAATSENGSVAAPLRALPLKS